MRDPNEIAAELVELIADLRGLDGVYDDHLAVIREAVEALRREIRSDTHSVPPGFIEATGDIPKVARTRHLFAGLRAGLKTAEEISYELQREETHGPGFIEGDTADTYRWILVPSGVVEQLRSLKTFTGATVVTDWYRGQAADIVARWEAATEEIEL